MQHFLLDMLEFLRKALTKAFDGISHDLLVATLNSYGFSTLLLRMINGYLNDPKQRTRVNNCFSSWRNLIYGVPHGSILAPLPFNIYYLNNGKQHVMLNGFPADYSTIESGLPQGSVRAPVLFLIYINDLERNIK